jgi:hypothetical protein
MFQQIIKVVSLTNEATWKQNDSRDYKTWLKYWRKQGDATWGAASAGKEELVVFCIPLLNLTPLKSGPHI